jgi:hypothetical protein
LEVISWEESASHFKDQGNTDLYQYANHLVYGKKFISLVYLAARFPFLYSDTDVLWYSSPEELDISRANKPFIKMSKDVDSGYYTNDMIKSLGEEKCWLNAPFNSGLMYLQGDFTQYPKWKELCHSLAKDRSQQGRLDFTEQTAFAILNNHFNAGAHWKSGEILIKTDDVYNLKYTRKYFPHIMARHYVHTRPTAFWRDFIYMCLHPSRPSRLKTKSMITKSGTP